MKYRGYWDILRVCTVIGYLLTFVDQTYGKECPPDAPQRAMQCVATFSGTRHGKENILSEWDFDRIEEACRCWYKWSHSSGIYVQNCDAPVRKLSFFSPPLFVICEGTFTRAINCAQDIIDSCDDHPDQKGYLRKYLDMSRMTDGIDHLCSHQKTDFINHIKCIQNQRPFVKKCAEAELAEFQTKVSVLEGDMEKILQAGCDFMQEVFNCQTSSVRRNCGFKPAEQLSKIMSYFVPAYCAANTDRFGQEDGFAMTTKGSMYAIIFSCLSGFLTVKIMNHFTL